jgi:hypothetical protein
MKNFQFWLLLLGSAFISGLMIEQIFLSKDIYRAQRTLVDDQEIASTGAAYQNTWRQLAVHIYYAGRQDPDLAAVLKNEKVNVSSTPPALPTPTSGTPSKQPSVAAPPHPAGT